MTLNSVLIHKSKQAMKSLLLVFFYTDSAAGALLQCRMLYVQSQDLPQVTQTWIQILIVGEK